MVFDHLAVDVVDIAGTDDDLEHATCCEGALEVFVRIEGSLVNLGLVGNNESQAGCTVCGCADVIGASDCFYNFGRHLGVIHCHPRSFLGGPGACTTSSFTTGLYSNRLTYYVRYTCPRKDFCLIVMWTFRRTGARKCALTT